MAKHSKHRDSSEESPSSGSNSSEEERINDGAPNEEEEDEEELEAVARTVDSDEDEAVAAGEDQDDDDNEVYCWFGCSKLVDCCYCVDLVVIRFCARVYKYIVFGISVFLHTHTLAQTHTQTYVHLTDCVIRMEMRRLMVRLVSVRGRG